MAPGVQIQLTGDIDGGAAVETLIFGLDGHDYEIDLSAANAQQLREALRPFVAAVRKAAAGTAAPGSDRPPAVTPPRLRRSRPGRTSRPPGASSRVHPRQIHAACHSTAGGKP
jgi:hypothetical protein